MSRDDWQTRKRNFHAARFRRKLRLRRAMLDSAKDVPVLFHQCDLPDLVSEHAAENPAGNPSPEATEKAQTPQEGRFLYFAPANEGTHNDH
ncbi:hypothetical protein [Paenirhodobacter sp. CAU 1674]|uniref:hypothetical protein n=1 Tax=Paenirhodobacter sp. CAU 1674 TaxID=3032596 RepID=UPI0023DB3C2C|nr:hypothetical protein [Paenirhodobacter sp. CAU 1674]MDF2140804.1 hypothetical protein [Paenirhodobacter sp. CAU 1674]